MLAVCSALVRFCFADCLGYESGSTVVSLSDHVFHGLMLTTRKHVNLAVWTGGFPISVGNLLVVQSSASARPSSASAWPSSASAWPSSALAWPSSPCPLNSAGQGVCR